jgi:hypothetical protein
VWRKEILPDQFECACRYWQCLPKTAPAPAPAPQTRPALATPPAYGSGRRLQAEASVAEAPAPSKHALLPAPQPSAEHRISGHVPAQMEAPAPAPAVSPAPLPARKGKGSYEPDFSLCGGMGDACPLTKRDLCVDAQYLDCPPKSHCVRQSKWYGCFSGRCSISCMHILSKASVCCQLRSAHPAVMKYISILCAHVGPSRSRRCKPLGMRSHNNIRKHRGEITAYTGTGSAFRSLSQPQPRTSLPAGGYRQQTLPPRPSLASCPGQTSPSRRRKHLGGTAATPPRCQTSLTFSKYCFVVTRCAAKPGKVRLTECRCQVSCDILTPFL